ncbi:PIR Superfamily Protein [Plasmodium ovale wallikeri]|uniref:PIR Superfamily Protein n=2 Tax=Plasmodium ovale TaxID=36330 RepID=A0A1A9ATF0_PLAOA|nr:PIR Superfamily Protein [Plasmodium ovale wallikeri]SBT59541.1 PIR Superfamily Protein [Plasmodium ovale wallikeri]SBT72860.1 PIR protein [Plasmodium ovale]
MESSSHPLPSVEFYNILDSKFVPCKYCKFCDLNIQNFNEVPTSVINLCYKLARNIEIVSHKIEQKSDQKDKLCNRLISWVDDQIINTYAYSDKDQFFKIITKLHTVWNEIIRNSLGGKDNNICKTGYIPNEFAKRKKIILMDDYCENYSIIREELDKTNADCKPYYQYLNDSVSIHTDIMLGCKEKDSAKYCPEKGEYCMYYPPSEFLKKKSCQIIKNPELIKIEEEEERTACETCPLCPIAVSKGDSESEACLEPDCAPVSERMISFDFSDKRAIFLLVFAVWGLFLTLFLFYKSTPFSSWLNTFFRKKRLYRENFKENELNEFVNGDYDTVDSNIENRRYDLTYNPV